ncbi:MAG: hypothetical protein EB108_06190 [Actinobacteria bacterium]|nr:hypothetical protein [Actinomycetota bacterium]
MAQKIWDRHIVSSGPNQPDLIYIDLHLVHEVTSPQAFDGLRLAQRTVRRPDLTVATEDHNVPTENIHLPIADPISAKQIEVLRNNAKEFKITLYPMGNPGQGIVHVIGPEQGRTLPGMTIVCGDSHTATHGAFGALAFGIGTIDASKLSPHVTWGTNPAQVVALDSRVPKPSDYSDATERDSVTRALEYMGLQAGTAIRDIKVDTVFIGSCTNSRIEDLRAAADVVRGRKVSVKRAMVVPGSHAVKLQAQAEGLDKVFIEAGLDWREPGCSMCLAMNPDKLAPQERAASTSNRNFEGRQGRGGRTHLVSPAVAAATAVAGHFASPKDLS